MRDQFVIKDKATADLVLAITHYGSIARSASRRYLVYSEADFEVFRPAGATRCTDGVKFGTEEGTVGPLLRAKFHAIGATTRV